MVNMSDVIGDDFLVNRTARGGATGPAGGGAGTLGKTASSMRVVVKTLKKNADENAR